VALYAHALCPLPSGVPRPAQAVAGD